VGVVEVATGEEEAVAVTEEEEETVSVAASVAREKTELTSASRRVLWASHQEEEGEMETYSETKTRGTGRRSGT
jgi:hypothetical protein